MAEGPRLMPGPAEKVTFAVKAGPGFVAGVGNGDPSCQEPNQARAYRCYVGLV